MPYLSNENAEKKMVISLLLSINIEYTSLAFKIICKVWLLLVTAMYSRTLMDDLYNVTSKWSRSACTVHNMY